MERIISGEHVEMVLNDLRNRFMAEYKEARESGYFIKTKRLWWQLITLGMVRRRLERIPELTNE